MPHSNHYTGHDTDGRTYAGHRDPPGQASVYIPSGDTWKEAYRASTFAQFPNTPVLPIHLSASGFYYTGFRDRVKCFSCGLSVENWIVGDDPRDKKWHKTDCDFANCRDERNIPLPSFLSKLRSTLSQRHSTLNQAQRPSTSRPTNCNGHSNRQANQNVATNTSQSSATSSSNISRAREEQDRHQLYPCRSPVNPHMTSVVARLESFKSRNGIRWPSEKLRAPVSQLVNAGFYYLCERDRVKCWYCNGGLQNWDYEDDPFEEHAKWFPSCEFIARVKGQAYVQNIVAQFPDIDRPTPTAVTRPQQQISNEGNYDIAPIPAPTSTSRNRSPVRRLEDTVEQAMQNLDYVRQAREMDFAENLIKDVLTRKYQANSQFFTSGEEFMDALISHQLETNIPTTTPAAVTQDPSLTSIEQNSVNDTFSELRKLEEARLCKICKLQPSIIVIIPCGHLSVCGSCASKDLKRCPICSRLVQDTIKTFRS